MLDEYIFGTVDRISPEAPVAILNTQQYDSRLGGAGNVAINLKELGVQVKLISIVGNDKAGMEFNRLLRMFDISTEYIIGTSNRITTCKKRLVAQGQQILRIDEEQTNELSEEEESKLLKKIYEYIVNEKPALLIMEDYDKGIFSPLVITSVINLCKQHGVLTAVDPKRKNFFLYKGVDLFKPNLKEVTEALKINQTLISTNYLNKLHDQLVSRIVHKITLITLSENGIFWHNGNQSSILPSHVRQVRDVSGAGDTVIAVASIFYALTKDIKYAATIANVAGGLVCEEIGTAVISKEKLIAECSNLFHNSNK